MRRTFNADKYIFSSDFGVNRRSDCTLYIQIPIRNFKLSHTNIVSNTIVTSFKPTQCADSLN